MELTGRPPGPSASSTISRGRPAVCSSSTRARRPAVWRCWARPRRAATSAWGAWLLTLPPPGWLAVVFRMGWSGSHRTQTLGIVVLEDPAGRPAPPQRPVVPGDVRPAVRALVAQRLAPDPGRRPDVVQPPTPPGPRPPGGHGQPVRRLEPPRPHPSQ